jgi:hypothetical protein
MFVENHAPAISFSTAEEIEQFVKAFDACTLPSSLWTHHAHLTVGLWYLTRQDVGEATLSIRYGIQRYNLSCGVRMTRNGGYHETITLFYVRAIGKYLQDVDPSQSLVTLREGLLESPCGDPKFPLSYYSKERLFSWEARTQWIPPDLKPLEE